MYVCYMEPKKKKITKLWNEKKKDLSMVYVFALYSKWVVICCIIIILFVHTEERHIFIG